MKAVNLIPADSRSGRGVKVPRLAMPTYVVIGVLVAALAMVTMHVLSANSVASRKAQIASLQSQLTQAQAEAAKLASFGQFASLEQSRVSSVRGIAQTRFDWNAALSQLADVIPANTSLQSLNGTVVPGAGAASGGLRADQPGPAFELVGCTSTQDEVASLISRLRAMHGVTRVALSSSAKANNSAGTSSSSGPKQGCKPNAPVFDLIVFFAPVQGAGAQGVTALGTSTTTTATGGTK